MDGHVDSRALWRGRALCLAAALLWSTSGLFIKTLAAAGWTGWQTAGLRSLIAGAVLLALAGPGRFRLPAPHQWVVALCLAPTVLLYTLAQAWTSTANAIFLQYTAPLYVLLLAPLLLGERSRLRDFLAVAAVLGGMAFILFSGAAAPDSRFSAASHRLGTAMAVASGVAFAGTMLALRKWRDGSGVLAAAWGNFLTAALALPAVFLLPRGFAIPEAGTGAQIMFLGVFQIGIAYWLFQKSLQILPASEASILALAEPVACPLWTFLILAEPPSSGALWGGGLIVAALALHSWAAAEDNRRAAEV
jgi:drug/metabolite transporter (DMT)-like permease